MSNKRKRIIIILSVMAALGFISVWIVWGNTTLIINRITITSDKLPQSFSGYRIAQISDLHNTEFGDDNEKLIEKLKDCKPDIIVFTGDLIDSHRTDIDVSIAFVEKAVQIAPSYFVTGNHESIIKRFNELVERLENAGVTVLQNKSVILEKNHDTMNLLGVRDPSFQVKYLSDKEASVMDSVLFELTEEVNGYTVLLSHRPEFFDIYASYEVDLVLCGHTHGGQFRLPFIGGIFAPGQGLFPKYDAGIYRENDTNMIVSRGVGNSIFPLRVNNKPEIVLVELNKYKR